MSNLAIFSLSDFENWNNHKSLSMGGSSGVIKSILPYLKADFIYLMGLTSDKMNLYKEIHLDGNIIIVPVVYVPRKSKIPVRIFAFWYSRRINSILKKYNIGSVYSHAEEISFWINPGFKFLYHMHGSTNALIKAKNRSFRLQLFQNLWEQIRRKNIKNAANIIAIDPLCYDLTKKEDEAGKTILLPNFVDEKIFYRDDSQSKMLEGISDKILLFIGRIEEVKGLELFADTLMEISKRESGNWKGVFVGSGTYEPVIRRYIDETASGELFKFAGPVFEQDELRRIYNRASVLMISSHSEGIPMVILESLACGTPVISTNVGGVKEILADNKMCFVNDNRNPSEFADIIQSVINKENANLTEFKYSSSKAAVLINNLLNNQHN